MIKFKLLICLLFCSIVSFAQKEAVNGVLITRIDQHDTSRTLYVNKGVNLLSVYTVENNNATQTATYQVKKSGNGFVFYCNNHQSLDTLNFAFQDQEHALIVNGTDRYILFPAFYTRFKNASVSDILNLLSDAIKEYPVNDALLFQTFSPQTSQHIQKAVIVTQRSQADVQDTWICRYFYNKINQLDSVNASNREEVRFHKKFYYKGAALQSSNTYLNIESRQISTKIMVFKTPLMVKIREKVLEAGKNRETMSAVTIAKRLLTHTELFKLINKHD